MINRHTGEKTSPGEEYSDMLQRVGGIDVILDELARDSLSKEVKF